MINKNSKFSSNVASPEARGVAAGRAASICWQKLKFGILTKFLQHRVVYDQ